MKYKSISNNLFKKSFKKHALFKAKPVALNVNPVLRNKY